MRNSEFGMRSWIRKRCFGIPHSAFCIPHSPGPRRGVSLLEVLFAILVTTIGLFGALALLPVASAQARKGRLNDAVSVVAPNCVHEFDARGYRSTTNWRAWNTVANDWRTFAPSFGVSVCIDPRFLAGKSPPANPAAFSFPYQEPFTDGNGNLSYDGGETYTDLNGNGVHDPIAGVAVMPRITLASSPSATAPHTELMADSIFVVNDDLAYDRADDNSLAPTQQFDFLPSLSTVRSRRLTEGHMSWMATVVPKLDRYSNPSTTFNNDFVLSIVVFYDRPAGMELDATSERTVNVSFPGGGVTGGEVLLSSSREADLALRPNDWIMLSGTMTHILGGTIPVFKWYRVSDLEAEISPNGTNFERYVTLVGPDWDVANININSHRAVIVDGVVGVYEKTIRLE